MLEQFRLAGEYFPADGAHALLRTRAILHLVLFFPNYLQTKTGPKNYLRGAIAKENALLQLKPTKFTGNVEF